MCTAKASAASKVILARAEGGKLIHGGGVGTGFNSKTGPALKKRLNAIRTEKPPIADLKEKGAVWARPEIVVQVAFTGWTAERHLRHPLTRASARIERPRNSASASLTEAIVREIDKLTGGEPIIGRRKDGDPSDER
jgi:ATP-dependent DNA ligase